MKLKLFVFILFLSFFSLTCFAQIVKEKELPGLVISYVEKHYNVVEYKIVSSEIKEDENKKPVYYLQIKKKGENKNVTELFFDMSGNFIKKIEPVEKEIEEESKNAGIENNDSTAEELQINKELKLKELPGPIVNCFKSNFNSTEYKIALAKIKEKNNGKKYYYVQVRKKGVHQPIASELFFDLSGNLIKKVNSLEKQMEREEFDDTEETEENQGQISSTNQQVDPKELPGLIISYVKKNYISAKYKIISSEMKEDKNQRPIYYLQIKEKGASKNITELFFDISGKFIKKITPLEKQMQGEEFDDE